MQSAWRLIKTKYIEDAFNGEGARLHGGRWNSAGIRAVYVSETLALATVEILVHLQSASPLRYYSCIPVKFDKSLLESINVLHLPPKWYSEPYPEEVVAIGNRWLHEGRSVVLKVPSAAIPAESNFVLNPLHPDFSRVKIGKAMPFTFDPRLLKRIKK